jgi:hypothetical protein
LDNWLFIFDKIFANPSKNSKNKKNSEKKAHSGLVEVI